MKTRSLTAFFCLCLLVVDCCMAQQKEPQANKQVLLKSTASSASGTEPMSGTALLQGDLSLEGTEGNLYVGDKWPDGILTLKGGKIIENYRFRYDVYADQMQFIAGDDTLAFASPAELYSVAFENMTFVYEPYECNNMLMKGYFQLLIPGKKQLLLKRTVTYHLPTDDKAENVQKDTYLISECYFLKSGNQPAYKVMCNKKSALVAMEDRKRELEEYLKKTGNKVKTLNDLKKMVEYYNSLD